MRPLPLPNFARSRWLFVGLAAVHFWLGGGHLLALVRPEWTLTDVWKGVGAVAGAYYFLALASRGAPTATASPPS